MKAAGMDITPEIQTKFDDMFSEVFCNYNLYTCGINIQLEK